MTTWRKSSYSGSQTDCVEVGHTPSLVQVRDTKDRQGAMLAVTPTTWTAFLTALK